MIKYFNKKNLKKIIIAILTVLVLNFVAPCYRVSAKTIGGTLLSPIIDLTTFIGDAVMGLIQYSTIGSFTVKLEFENTGFLNGDLELPVIRVSPEEIFLNEIPLFDVNFISPMEDKTYKNFAEDGSKISTTDDSKKTSTAKVLRDTLAKWYVVFRNISIVVLLSVLIYIGIKIIISAAGEKAKYKQLLMDWLVGLALVFLLHFFMVFTLAITQTITNGLSAKSNPITIDLTNVPNAAQITMANATSGNSTEDTDALKEFAEVDGTGRVTKWKVNYMGYIRFYVEYWRVSEADAPDENANSTTSSSSSSDSNSGDSSNSSSDSSDSSTEEDAEANKKAEQQKLLDEYKEANKNNPNVSDITRLASITTSRDTTSVNRGSNTTSRDEEGDKSLDLSNPEVAKYINTDDLKRNYESLETDEQKREFLEIWKNNAKNAGNNTTASGTTSSSSGQTSGNASKKKNESLPVLKSVSYLIIYIAMIILTVRFVVIYIKRVLTMAMLTVIAPLMGMIYPIDKFGNGKAEGFQKWFKEYTMNALLQPFHLIIYTIVMSSVIDLAKSSPIYAVVAMGCIIPLEKLMRELFQFEGRGGKKIGTLGTAVGATAAWNAAKNLSLPKISNVGKGGDKSKLPSTSGENSKIKYANSNLNKGVKISDFLEGAGGNKDNNQNSDIRTSNNGGNFGNGNNEIAIDSVDDNSTSKDNTKIPESNENQEQLNDQDNILLRGNNIGPDQPNNSNRIANKVDTMKKIRCGSKTFMRSLTGDRAKRIYRRAARTAGMGVGLAVGAANGVVSGDITKGIGIALAGAGVGRKLGDKAFVAGDSAKDSFKAIPSSIKDATRNVKNDYLDQIESKDQQEIRYRQQARTDFKNDVNTKKFLDDKYKNQNLSRAEHADKLDTAADLKMAGIDDMNSIGNGLDLVDYNMKNKNMSKNDAIQKAAKVNALSNRYSEKDLIDNRDQTQKKIKEEFENKVTKDAMKEDAYKNEMAKIDSDYAKELEGKQGKEKAAIIKQKRESREAAKQEYLENAKKKNKENIEKSTNELMNSLDIMKGIRTKN